MIYSRIIVFFTITRERIIAKFSSGNIKYDSGLKRKSNRGAGMKVPKGGLFAIEMKRFKEEESASK